MLANVRVFIIIGDEPSSTKDKKTYENYDLLSTAQLIEKIMKEVFNIPQKDIITFAYGNHKKYMDLLEKTQRKLITQISHEEILYQVPSDLSGYIFFENKESLYKLIIKFSILHQNTDLFLFILDHGNIGSIIKIPYIQIYQATLNGFPKSIRIFNDCCHGGSIITSIEQYSRFYNKVKLTREKVSMNPPFDLHFIPDYVMMARKMSYNIFFSEIKWLTAFCEVRNSQKFEVFVDDFCKKNYSLYKTLNPDLPVSDYIDDFVSNTNDLSDILTLINQVQIKTIGQLVAAIVFTLHRKFPKCRVSSITRDDANIFLKLCGENEKNVKRILITADKEAETKLILKLEEGKKITLEETKNDNNEFQLNLKTNQDTEIKLFFAVEQKDSNKIIQVEEDQEKGGEQVLGEEEEREQQQSLRLNIKPQQMEIERQPKKISQNINEEKNEKELKIIIKTEEKYEINLITFLEKNINSNTDLERKKFIQLILKEEQENIIKLMIKLEQESNTEIQQNLMPEHEYEIEFLTDVLNIDFESIYPPVSDRRIFASSGIYSKSFTFISTPISPRLKINAGSPGVSEAIHEIFLRNSDDSVDFHRIKTNLTISKDGKFK
ncbi:hypothetical protein TRFO_06054 [Tritrichomonas foetus]|uniref:Uncharacterized protein n=1 Tax=Tritrichomonas foetus TaxID=1144522 RepID=A0A1J4K106_9EUKA|nr:hypothetical protein TRFO_06054 [Tritrichomonas foetus]|eukprot:OHT05063.1 hypothetical protein TRFO_06054 [Tritrichomonas foetus]